MRDGSCSAITAKATSKRIRASGEFWAVPHSSYFRYPKVCIGVGQDRAQLDGAGEHVTIQQRDRVAQQSARDGGNDEKKRRVHSIPIVRPATLHCRSCEGKPRR
jgi:hypothetical protein